MFATADLCDQFSEELQIAEPIFKSFGEKRSFYGKIATVKVFEDNVLVVDQLEKIEEGSVLVVDGQASTKCALLGDRLATIAFDRKISGIIINGCVRDSAELEHIDVGILAIATNPLKSKKKGEGQVGISLHFGGVTWTPGEYIYCDGDGVVLAKRKLL
ncbi:ribonuclease E activity regulator RraA [Bacillus carboniphilus]|uniref:4-hydroxy-4-methyl-2-oxoglutarate aldolase n=1 Tax=Bacillus carboniphilus TaxID=86663 RepID=A0ABY9JSA1_9BACI|nr:ribonuclease E activity regulator RraA [Bacillus carboniphilus]WLR41368.1 ribonuclease E activity regulator RraA [Bacillus carboniphilus]